MNDIEREDAQEASHGPFRVIVDKQDLRGYWDQETALGAADDLARSGRPAAVKYVARDWSLVKPHNKS